jgi:Phytoene dehydrogenase and related proteins
MTSYDTIILGSSPNALTAACYLARSGKKVLVLEPSEHLGGAATTAQFAEGYKGDIGLISGRLDESIIKDLELSEQGLEIIQRNSITSLLPDGKSFTLPADRDAATKVIQGFSKNDAAKYKSFMQLVDLATDFLKSAYAMTPPQNHPPSKADVEQLTLLTAQLKGYGKREMMEVMRVLVMSVRDFMDEWFESAELKGLLGSAAIRGINQGPFAGNTVFTLLHHLAQGDGFFRATANGGVGAISQALSKDAQAHGVEVRTKTGPLKINVTDGVATGVMVATESINATTIISDFDARYTFTELVPPPELEPEFNRAVRNVRYSGAVARVNFALNGLPEFPGVTEEALKGTLAIAPSLAYLEKAFDGSKRGEISEHPFIELMLPSLSDSTLAPSGKHVMSVWMQYVPFRGKVNPDSLRELAIKELSALCPNFKSLIEHSQVITPRELESQFQLSEGNLSGGEINLAQAFYLRPIPGFAQYHTPISQLYLCGSATHPGGINGLSGRNAVRELGVRDMVAV